MECYDDHERAVVRAEEIDKNASQDKGYVINTNKESFRWFEAEALVRMQLRYAEGLDDPPSAA